MLLKSLLVAALVPVFVVAQEEGVISGPTSSAAAAGYSCDSSKCKLPDCNCASTSPPGGLQPVRTCSSSVENTVLKRIYSV